MTTKFFDNVPAKGRGLHPLTLNLSGLVTASPTKGQLSDAASTLFAGTFSPGAQNAL